MIRYEGPYLLHCSLGKDRSGFMSLLLEMLEDYMRTYESFCRITEKAILRNTKPLKTITSSS